MQMEHSTSQVTIKPPRPETLKAKLVSVAIEKPTFTVHRYVETVAVIIEAPKIGDADSVRDVRGWAFVFECTETGFRRRYGIVDRTVDVPDAEFIPSVKKAHPIRIENVAPDPASEVN